MPRYEYKVVPAPSKGQKIKGVKTAEARFALAVEQVMNDLAEQGWEYQRTELLPSDERSGLTGKAVNWRNVMVFRREMAISASSGDGPQQGAGAIAPAVLVTPMITEANVAAPAAISMEDADPQISAPATFASSRQNIEEDSSEETPDESPSEEPRREGA